MNVAVLLALICLCYVEVIQAFVFRPQIFTHQVTSPRQTTKSVALSYASIKVEREPEDDDNDVVDRYFSLLAESDVLDIAMSKQRMVTKNDAKKRRQMNARVKTLKYADDEDEDDDDEMVEHGDTKLPQYQDLGL